MVYLLGSAITLAIVLLVFVATHALSREGLSPLRTYAYILSVAVPTFATAPDLMALAAVAVPALAMYEAVIAFTE